MDIHNLNDRAKRFVVGVVLRRTFEEKERTGLARPLLFVVLDELNKYAPREGSSPIKEILLDVAERGRSLGIILIGALAAVAGGARATGTTIRRFSPHFFVLGVAFLLLTTRSLVSFSLLFGTTWAVNAMAFFAILASVLLAIFVNARWPIRLPTPFYALRFASIALAFRLPPESLLIDPPWLR